MGIQTTPVPSTNISLEHFLRQRTIQISNICCVPVEKLTKMCIFCLSAYSFLNYSKSMMFWQGKKPCKKHEWSEDSPVRCQQGVEGRDSLGEVSFVEDARQTETILTEILMIPAGTVIEECLRHCSSQTKYPPCFSR